MIYRGFYIHLAKLYGKFGRLFFLNIIPHIIGWYNTLYLAKWFIIFHQPGSSVRDLFGSFIRDLEKGLSDLHLGYQRVTIPYFSIFYNPGGPSRPLNSHSPLEVRPLF